MSEIEEVEEFEPFLPVRERHAETTTTELVWCPWLFSITIRRVQAGARDE